MPTNPTVKELGKDQIALLLGQKITSLGAPELSVSKIIGPPGSKDYKISISFSVTAAEENASATPKPFPTNDSFAVLKIANAQTIAATSSTSYFTVIQNGGADDYQLSFSILGEIPGSKGDHGS